MTALRILAAVVVGGALLRYWWAIGRHDERRSHPSGKVRRR